MTMQDILGLFALLSIFIGLLVWLRQNYIKPALDD